MWPRYACLWAWPNFAHFSPSSEPLARILATGLTLIGAKHVDYGNDH